MRSDGYMYVEVVRAHFVSIMVRVQEPEICQGLNQPMHTESGSERARERRVFYG